MSPVALYERYGHWYDAMIAAIGHRRSLRDYFSSRPSFRSGLRVLDAGCGSGASLLAVLDAARGQGVKDLALYGFDASPAMLETARRRLRQDPNGTTATLLRAALLVDALPPAWMDFDLIISSGMLEYLPKTRLAEALKELSGRLASGGRLIAFISKDNPWNRLFIGALWRAEVWSERQFRDACAEAGLSVASFGPFKRWGYVVEAVPERPRIA